MIRRIAIAVAALLALATPAAAQVPDVTGSDDSPAVRIAREVLARRQYVWMDRDTVLGPEFRITGDLVVYDAEVRLEGNVDGSVVVLGGDFWVRPRGRVGGAIAALNGGVYPSGLAIVQRDSIFRQDPRTGVTVETVATAEGGYTAQVVVTAPPRPPLFAPNVGPFPTYDRVNGLTVHASGTLRPTRRAEGPAVRLWGSYRFEQENHLGGGVGWQIPLGTQNLRLTGEASRATRTNDAWIQGDVSNSLRALVVGRDYRDYWDADVLRVMVERPVGKPLIAGESWLGPRAGLQASRDRSLPTRAPWSLFGEGLERENPPIIEGTVLSALAGAEYHWVAATSRLNADLLVEHALGSGEGLDFTQARLAGDYFAMAFRTHTLNLRFRGMAPIGGDAPPQRYGILGGGGTLPTEPIARFRGDHLAYVESSYLVPYERIVLPYLGSPSLELRHAVGAAWTGDDSPSWVQNAGVGVVFSFVYARLLLNPADRPLSPTFSFGVAIPQF